MLKNEFELIEHYFKSQPIKRKDVVLGIGDDAALVCVPPMSHLVVTTDTLVVGNHFLEEAPPEKVAYKALASNLSDLAAMGAVPAWCSLALTLPHFDETWLHGFCRAFYLLAQKHDVQLIGGDTTKGPLSITLTLQGYLPEGRALRRDGARPGDCIYVTGSLGDSAAGLDVILKRRSPQNELERTLLERHYYSIPRVKTGQLLREWASSALDISDGLVADLTHLLKASKVSARLNAEALPVSDALLEYTKTPKKAAQWALCSGEEYELCFTVPEKNRLAMERAFLHHDTPITCIGRIHEVSEGKEKVSVFWQGKEVQWSLKGWDHFSNEGVIK